MLNITNCNYISCETLVYNMKIFDISTHHTYLNIFPIVTPATSIGAISVSVFDDLGNVVFEKSDFSTMIELQLPAGKFCIVGTSRRYSKCVQNEKIIVEDALKYGSSKIKKGFVYTDSPWLFLLTGERMYVWNRETNTGKVEHYLAPDRIISHCMRKGSSSPYFIFQTGKECGVYNVENGQIIFSFSGYIYSNNNVVIYEDPSGTIHIYDYINYREIGNFKGNYSFTGNNTYKARNSQSLTHLHEKEVLYTDKKSPICKIGEREAHLTNKAYFKLCKGDNDLLYTELLIDKEWIPIIIDNDTEIDSAFYYVDEFDCKVYCIRGNIISEVDEVCSLKGKKYILSQQFLLVLIDEKYQLKTYRIYVFGCWSRAYEFSTNCNVEYCIDKSCSDNAYMFDKLAEVNAVFAKVGREYNASFQITTDISFQTLSIEKLYIEIKGGIEFLHIEFYVNTYRSKSLKEKELKLLTLKPNIVSNISAATSLANVVGADISAESIVVPNKSNLICNSEDGVLSVYAEENRIYLYDNRIKSKVSILENLYTHNFYQSAYFTSDGKSLVMVNDNSIASLVNYDNITAQTQFSIEGIGVTRINGFNGYKPEINIIPKAGAIPRWRDPITLNYVYPCDSGFYKYISPCGNISASVKLKELYVNILTIEELKENEYTKLRNMYDFKTCFVDKELESKDREMKIKSRTALLQSQYNFAQLSVKYSAFLRKYFYRTQKYDWTAELKTMSELWRIIFENKTQYIEKPTNFTDYIVLKIGYIECEEQHDTFRIFIGDSLWFLNYVSFSFDEHFIAVGAKRCGYKYIDKQGCEVTTSQSGVFILFDLDDKDESIRYDTDNSSLQAVWTTAFSRRGDCAFYDSTPNSYIVHNATATNFAVEKISGKSFLGFSTTGRYVAMSKQGYVDYTHHSNERWGHQPCGSIYVHSVNDLQHTLAHFNDFAEGIKDVGVARSVASIAFSQDECRLLAVGTDGVVVVRNLHFAEETIFAEFYEEYVNRYYGDNVIPYEIFIDDEILEYYRSYYADDSRPIGIFIEENQSISVQHNDSGNLKTSYNIRTNYVDDDDYRYDYGYYPNDNDPLDAFEGDEDLYDEWLINS